VILLDTNVVSEPMRAHPDPKVLAWLDSQLAETLYLTATSLAELLVGIELLPTGKRRERLRVSLSDLIHEIFDSRVLPFDSVAAIRYASIISRARASGTVLSVADAQIAAIASVNSFAVATRDTAPFVASGIPVINPWIESAT